MNILNFNDGVTSADFAKFGMSPSCAVAPVFYGRATDYGDVAGVSDARKLLYQDGFKMPFSPMRLWLEPPGGVAEPFQSYRCFLEAGPTSFQVMAFLHAKKLQLSGVCITAHMQGTFDCQFYFAARGGWVSGIESGKKDAMIAGATGILDSIAVYLALVNSPANFIASVTPGSQGKSVEWKTARTHYVVLHKTHPANVAGVKEGELVKETEGYLKRCAHSRRAHYRILRSPRFRHKLGQRVWVKSCWCGPKEWKQASSIYRLYEPPKVDA